jgi:serine/threonine-protein kinase
MPVNRFDRLFAHVASITGLLTAGQIGAMFRSIETGEARDALSAASKILAPDVAAAIGIIATELSSRRIAEGLEPATIVAAGKAGGRDSTLQPRALGDYRNLRKIARGAMGLIFKAEHKDGRTVALKVLPRQMVREPQDIERFKREVETITSLVHPNIVRVFDYGQDEDFYYYAMEFLDGRSLRELITDRGHLSPVHAAEICRDAARGLAFAHQHGVIHRDVKPSNVMICKDGSVKLVDFGLAFTKQSDILTATGISLGTPAYMSPEQIEGGRKEVGERSDIYSLGVTLYEAASGKRPFEGDNQYDVMKRVLFDEPQPAATANPSVPEELSQVIGKAMAKSPADRYARMPDMIAALDKYLEA